MSADTSLTGLACPRCGGMIPIPEGQAIVSCPFCELRSIIRGEQGIRRLQVPLKVSQEAALQAWNKFLTRSFRIARNTKNRAKLNEVFLAYVPFWSVSGHGLAWGFGQKREGSGDNRRYVPKELRVAEELHWNQAACDMGEFGVNRVRIDDRPVLPFEVDVLNQSGLVFEAVGASSEALQTAQLIFERDLKRRVRLDRQTQLFTRIVRPILSIVYYPLWVVRYTVLGRTFQVVLDGYSGEVLSGKAPGSVAYRAGALVLGMAAGAVMAIDVPALMLLFWEDNSVVALLILFVLGLGLMVTGWRIFRYAEHYEYQRYKPEALDGLALGTSLPPEAREMVEMGRRIGLVK